ncbi:trem-like transcript 4 protein [Nannospalax galili]|uniref:trem-like transcript 4 protein n=1 Tax=Nannospalax galili TaxID=1026970 RepID=UPI0004ED026F|nr:trem-like transcript 4 protein [Nannospalax galili]
MAQGCPYLPLTPLLLALLVSGSWGVIVEPEELHGVVGQTLSMRCQYMPKTGPYVPKTWCQQTAPNRCTRVVTTTQPRTAANEQRHTIWDDPEAGFFIINVTQLKETDSAPYWCGHYNASHRMVTVLRNISLVVSLGTAVQIYGTGHCWLERPQGTPSESPYILSNLVHSSFTNQYVALNKDSIFQFFYTDYHLAPNKDRNGNSTSSFDWTSPGLLVSVQYGLLLLKVLALSVLWVILCCRCYQINAALKFS